ncbi:MAG: dTDP-4-dehydrorhamnose reductase [Methylotenera sp.]|nr:dTDP-4-dehydrorhamnose reductase [Methylotenera sp.]
MLKYSIRVSLYKKILITGVNGQVGQALNEVLRNTDIGGSLIGLSRTELDLSNPHQIRQVIHSIKPDLIINPAAYTAVDKAESEPDLAYVINAIAPRILAEEAAKVGARLVHFSTDYVYNGNKPTPYTEADATKPLSVYGKSKLAGEEAIRAVGLPHLIFRTSWVYGAYGKNFLKTILRLASEREELRIVTDQFGAPTAASSIATAVSQAIIAWHNDTTGVYHMVNAGQTSWHGFASAIVNEYGRMQSAKGWPPLKVEQIHEITTQEFPTPAIRPVNSCLDVSKLARDFSVQLPDWRVALKTEVEKLAL